MPDHLSLLWLVSAFRDGSDKIANPVRETTVGVASSTTAAIFVEAGRGI